MFEKNVKCLCHSFDGKPEHIFMVFCIINMYFIYMMVLLACCVECCPVRPTLWAHRGKFLTSLVVMAIKLTELISSLSLHQQMQLLSSSRDPGLEYWSHDNRWLYMDRTMWHLYHIRQQISFLNGDRGYSLAFIYDHFSSQATFYTWVTWLHMSHFHSLMRTMRRTVTLKKSWTKKVICFMSPWIYKRAKGGGLDEKKRNWSSW